MSIATECMIVNLSIAVWTGQRMDWAATSRVITEAQAATDAARVNKHLVPKEALKPIITAQGAVRTHFYTETLPWRDNGDRLLTRKRFLPFIERHAALKADFDSAVDTFLRVTYLSAREKAGFRMGKLFNPDDYPAPEALARRFGVTLDIDAVTEAGDFRVALDEKHAEHMKGQIERITSQRLGKAMLDVWERLADAVTHIAERLQDKDTVFRNSLIDNLSEVLALLPDLNITDDPELERLRQQAHQRLTGFTPAALRADPALRQQAHEAALELSTEIKGIMSAFGRQGEDA